MDILVISACSGTKRHDAVLNCEDADSTSREDLIEEFPDVTEPAKKLYEGNEHKHVSSAVESLREFVTVDWVIISAGFGVISTETPVPSCECTFSDDESNEARARWVGYDSEKLIKKETLQAVANEKSTPSDFIAVSLAFPRRQIRDHRIQPLFCACDRMHACPRAQFGP